MTPSGIEPATFRFVVQHLNHCATAVPCLHDYITLKCSNFLLHVSMPACALQTGCHEILCIILTFRGPRIVIYSYNTSQQMHYFSNLFWYRALYVGIAVAQWLSCCATNRNVAGSIPDCVIGIFHSHNSPDRTMTLGSTQPLTEMSTRRIS